MTSFFFHFSFSLRRGTRPQCEIELRATRKLRDLTAKIVANNNYDLALDGDTCWTKNVLLIPENLANFKTKGRANDKPVSLALYDLGARS